MAKAKSHLPAAQCILDAYHATRVGNVTYFFAGNAWHSGDRKLDELIVSLDPSTTRSDRAEIRDLVSLMAPEGEFAPARYIAFMNGVLDILTMRFSAPSPDLLVPNQIPWDWDPGARSTVVEDYLDSTSANDASARARIEEMLGASLYRGKLPYLFIIVGMAPVADGDASNGKSTLIALDFALVGRRNALALDIQLFGQRFMAANLAGKLVVGSPDAPSTKPDANSLSVLKSTVTSDPVSSDTKNGPLVEFRPYATVVIAANRVPPFIVDAGLKRRPVVIPLKARFPKNGPDPLDALANDANMSALLVRAVDGLKRLIEQGPTPCVDGDRAFGGLIALSSSIEQWADDEGVEPAGLNGEPCASVYQRYSTWCGFAGEKPLARGEFDHEIMIRWPGLVHKRCRFSGQATTKRWIYATPAAATPVK